MATVAADTAAGGKPGGPTPKSALRDLLDSPAQLEQVLRSVFHKLARPTPQGDRLYFEDMEGLAASLAAELQVDPGIFGEMSQMFWRFDFSGDGVLDEHEGTQLCLCMLRRCRDATRPPSAGAIRLGAGIAYRNVTAQYEIDRKLGEGGQGAVFLARERRGSKQLVVKMYDKSSPNAPVEDITREFELLTSIRHPRIARVYEIFQDHSNIYVVSEPYFGGDLAGAVHKAAAAGIALNERWLAQVMQQVLAGVGFLHSKRVMHCDLKEPNVMIVGQVNWQTPQIVLIDFGLANEFATRSYPGGTPGYMPPEVWEYGLWTPKGDIFSVGVMLFSMRTGRQPFCDGAGASVLEEVRRQTRECHPCMGMGSVELQALVSAMTAKDFRVRPTVSAVQSSAWLSATAAQADHPIDDSVLSALLQRQERTDLRRAFLADFASRENLAQLSELNELFLQLDDDNVGSVSADKLHRGLAEKWPKETIESLIQGLVGSDEGEVSYEEFMGQLIAAMEPVENELLWRLFCEAGGHTKGYLDLTDVRALLQRPAVAHVLASRQPAALLAEMDINGDGRVAFEEFKLAMQGRAVALRGLKDTTAMGSIDRALAFFRLRVKAWRQDQRVEYYSTTLGAWIPCVITQVDPATGAVQVDCKPDYWLSGVELQTRLRRGPSILQRVTGSLRPILCGLCLDSSGRRYSEY